MEPNATTPAKSTARTGQARRTRPIERTRRSEACGKFPPCMTLSQDQLLEPAGSVGVVGMRITEEGAERVARVRARRGPDVAELRPLVEPQLGDRHEAALDLLQLDRRAHVRRPHGA